MKRIALAVSIAASLSTQAADLTVEVRGVKQMQGAVVVAVYDNAETWLKRPRKAMRVEATAATVTATFKGLAEGDYALSTFHDVNGNGKLDTNFIGIPREPYGFSNDATGAMGPPSFDKAKLALPTQGARIAVTLKD